MTSTNKAVVNSNASLGIEDNFTFLYVELKKSHVYRKTEGGKHDWEVKGYKILFEINLWEELLSSR